MTTYFDAGVDLDRAAQWVQQLKQRMSHIGGFGGVYPLGDHDLVASTDGVGTKLQLATLLERHDTVGVDLVAMNVNDILTSGAKPLFFLDYLSLSKLDLRIVEQILAGILHGCSEVGCTLIGGETAQMPGMYKDGEYDIAGFAVGIVKRTERIDINTVKEGDLLVGLASSGVHSNGYSLIRHILQRHNYAETVGAQTIGDILLTPTRIYVKQVEALRQQFSIQAMANITGGGFIKNIPRALPKGLTAKIREGSWPIPDIFHYLQKAGNIAEEEMRRVFNRGIGFVLILSPKEARRLCEMTKDSYLIGEVVAGEQLLWQ